MFPVGQLEQMGKQVVAMFEQAMRMFTPFDSGKATERQSQWALSQSNRQRFRVSKINSTRFNPA